MDDFKTQYRAFLRKNIFWVIVNMKKIFAAVLAAAFIISGAGAQAQAAEEVRLPIVMYHHISPNPSRWNEYVISVDEFRADMEYLRDGGWTPVSMAELLAWSRGEFTMPEKPCMITFDDGFSSTAEYAEPILEELGFRAVVAVIGSVCDRYSASGEYDPEWSDLSWEDAAAMAERGVFEVQCHTWNMHTMEGVIGCSKKYGESLGAYRWRLSTDLSRFLTESERHGLKLAYSIAYPFGAYDRDTTDIVRDMGFLAAFTCAEKINVLTGEDSELYYLGRYNRPHGISSEKFFGKWEKVLDMG